MLPMLFLNRMSQKRRLNRKQTTPKLMKNGTRSSTEFCRTCLSQDDLVSIFYSKETEAKRSEDLKLVTGLEIKMNDGLSQKICTRCIETMNAALQLRQTSRRAEKTLLNMLKHKDTVMKTKTEKVEIEAGNTENYSFDYDVYGEDFQNDSFYGTTEEKVDTKQKQLALKKKRVPQQNTGSYKCPTCNKEFRMNATFKAHLRFHTNYCVCESCGKRCRNNNQLQEHKRARHGLGKIHKCAYCEYSSATKEALVIHERRHTGERPYICDHCGATFHRRSNLVQHIAIHLPEKNFQCPTCPKREKSRKLLAIHEYKYHKRNKYRYVCPICGDTFTRPGNVRQHLARSHGVAREYQSLIERVLISDQPNVTS